MSWHLTVTDRSLTRDRRYLCAQWKYSRVLHAVPLVGRVRLGHEVGHAGRHLGVAAGDLLADPGDRLGHLDDPVEIGVALAGQAAHEVELDLAPAAPERLGAAFIQVFVVDRLADLLAHVVARDLGASVRPLRRPSARSAGIFLRVSVIRRLGSEIFTPSGVKTSLIRVTSSSKSGIVAGREREQADLVVARVLVALERGLDDRLDRAIAERPLDHRALAEPALPGAAAHDLDGDPVVGRLDKGDDRPGRQRDPSRSPITHGRIDSGTSSRVRRISRIVPSSR